jgi:hypothetical protein
MPRSFWVGIAVGAAGLFTVAVGGVALLTALAAKFWAERDDIVR